MTVCARPSTSLTCRIMAAKACASASRLASLSVLSSSMLRFPATGMRGTSEIVSTGQGVSPPVIWARGNRSKSFFTQPGG